MIGRCGKLPSLGERQNTPYECEVNLWRSAASRHGGNDRGRCIDMESILVGSLRTPTRRSPLGSERVMGAGPPVPANVFTEFHTQSGWHCFWFRVPEERGSALVYSYRNASIGFSLAAFSAGKNPETMP